MNLIKNLKKAGLLLALCLLFTTNVKANNIKEVETIEVLSSFSDNTMSIDCIYNENYGPGWDKFKKAVKEFLEGVLEGFGGGLGGEANTGGGDINSADLQYISNFALNTISTREKASELLYQANKLILNTDSNTITKRQLSALFSNDARMMTIIMGDNDSIFPLDKNDENLKSFWRKLGRIIGRIGAILLLQEING